MTFFSVIFSDTYGYYVELIGTFRYNRRVNYIIMADIQFIGFKYILLFRQSNHVIVGLIKFLQVLKELYVY